MYRQSNLVEQSGKVCCTSGTPSVGDHAGVGKEVNFPTTNVDAYISASLEDKNEISRAVIVAYDIFGFHIENTRRFVDKLVASDSMQAVAIMPDFFRGNPFKVENFPPKDYAELREWIGREGNWSIVEPILNETLAYIKANYPNVKSNVGIMGFCWGGCQVVNTCGTTLVKAGVSLHGAMFGEEMAQKVQAPIMFLHAGDDAPLDGVKAVLDQKPFGKDCHYQVFSEEKHGFAAARGDWNVEHTKKAVQECLELASGFFKKHLV